MLLNHQGTACGAGRNLIALHIMVVFVLLLIVPSISRAPNATIVSLVLHVSLNGHSTASGLSPLCLRLMPRTRRHESGRPFAVMFGAGRSIPVKSTGHACEDTRRSRPAIRSRSPMICVPKHRPRRRYALLRTTRNRGASYSLTRPPAHAPTLGESVATNHARSLNAHRLLNASSRLARGLVWSGPDTPRSFSQPRP